MWVGIELGSGSLIFFSLWHMGLFFRTSDILCDDDGLAYILYGKQLRRVHWKDIKRICLYNPGQNPDVDPIRQGRCLLLSVVVYVTESKRMHWWLKNTPLIFSDRRPEKRELLDIVNEHVRAQGIPIFDYREGRKGEPLAAL